MTPVWRVSIFGIRSGFFREVERAAVRDRGVVSRVRDLAEGGPRAGSRRAPAHRVRPLRRARAGGRASSSGVGALAGPPGGSRAGGGPTFSLSSHQRSNSSGTPFDNESRARMTTVPRIIAIPTSGSAFPEFRSASRFDQDKVASRIVVSAAFRGARPPERCPSLRGLLSVKWNVLNRPLRVARRGAETCAFQTHFGSMDALFEPGMPDDQQWYVTCSARTSPPRVTERWTPSVVGPRSVERSRRNPCVSRRLTSPAGALLVVVAEVAMPTEWKEAGKYGMRTRKRACPPVIRRGR